MIKNFIPDFDKNVNQSLIFINKNSLSISSLYAYDFSEY